VRACFGQGKNMITAFRQQDRSPPVFDSAQGAFAKFRLVQHRHKIVRTTLARRVVNANALPINDVAA
jgi:hypothetical protein